MAAHGPYRLTAAQIAETQPEVDKLKRHGVVAVTVEYRMEDEVWETEKTTLDEYAEDLAADNCGLFPCDASLKIVQKHYLEGLD